jgi:hypothetical protein
VRLEPLVVRPAMGERVGHATQARRVRRRPLFELTLKPTQLR